MSVTAIVDYGVGNLFSLRSSVKALEGEALVTGNPEDIHKADRILLPGVGAFGDAIAKLRNTGLVPVLEKEIAAGKPLMGICLGMQLLFEKSHEYGEHAGLGWLPGEVKSLAEALKIAGEDSLKVPHMGWNSLTYTDTPSPLLKDIPEGSFVYFVHSFYATGCEDSLRAWAPYGVSVPAVVEKNNVFGCQFHPEKSGSVGLKILDAFLKL
ncbi:MAG: imidazole glycerol phosphate synthase subunit HisH [Oscillospiraceae bacterium]|nr:imidazole glycerol phosphate synthase subunit HisH [Oscillospiraceae bacterium]